MKKAVIYIMLFSFLCLQLTGCATSMAERGMLGGAAVGAVVGAAVGGRPGALIGGFIGGLFGAAIGNYHDSKTASRTEAINKYRYNFRESIIEIEDSSILPQYAESGTKLEAHIQYTVLSPESYTETKITETRILDIGSERIVLAEREVSRAQGTYASTFRFSLPGAMPKGNHTLITVISSNDKTKITRVPFSVV